jgi:nickel/cobalt transporter (NicO) family protein
MKRIVVALFAVAAAVIVPAVAASAHPLGNFTVNQYSGLRIGSDAVTIDLVTDEAEIPTVQARSAIDANHDGDLDAGETARWQDEQCNAAAASTTLMLDRQPVAVHAAAGAGALTFPAGQAGLVTLRLECELRADASIGSGRHDVDYRNSAFRDRIGWHEIVAAADGGTVISSDVATTSVTQRLTSYPTDQLRSPLNQRAASVTFNVDGGGVAVAVAPRVTPNTRAVTGLLPRGADRASRAFTSLVARHDLTFAFALVALGIALGLGSLHALAPGHGKTVMAAYIVGQRGSLRQAALIGLTVTATHTAGVLALGIVLTTSNALAPERLYPWLGILSGLLLASIGVTLARRAWRIRRMHAAAALAAIELAAHDHDHHDHHDHDHHEHDHHHHHEQEHHHEHEHEHEHDHDHEGALAHSHGGWVHSHPTFDESIGWRSLVAVGFAGGLVPSPSALLVLVGAIALGRTWFGLALVTAYGVGMAVMLTGAGLLLVRARRVFERRALLGRRSARLAVISRLVPLATSTVIITVGLALAARSAGKI